MVGPERKRQAVLHVRQELEVTERRGCTTIRQPRATQRYRGIKRGKDAALPICDELSRELMALEVERRMEAKDVIRILDEAVIARGCMPEFIRSDNGPEFVALAVQDWIARRGCKTLSIAPGSPWAERLQRELQAAGSGTSSSTGKPSRQCWRGKCSASNTGTGTTKSARIRRWMTKRRQSSHSAA